MQQILDEETSELPVEEGSVDSENAVASEQIQQRLQDSVQRHTFTTEFGKS